MRPVDRIRRGVWAALCIMLIAGFTAHPLRAQDPEALLERIQSTYDAVEALRANFTQTIRSSFSDRSTTNRGSLLLQSDKFRIETEQQTLVADGETTWIYTPSTNQVIVNDYVNDETTLTPDEVFYDYAERFRVESMDTETQSGDRIFELNLAPKDSSAFYQSVILHLRDRDTAITRLRLEDRNGTTITFTLDDIQFNPSVTGGTFTFSPPSDAEVVDLRS